MPMQADSADSREDTHPAKTNEDDHSNQVGLKKLEVISFHAKQPGTMKVHISLSVPLLLCKDTTRCPESHVSQVFIDWGVRKYP